MEKTCLLVDLDESGIADSWQDLCYGHDFALELSSCNGEDVYFMLGTGRVACLILFCKDPDKQEIYNILELYKKNVGAIAAFQAIVCDEPDPVFMTQVYEWGIENFYTNETWPSRVAALCEEVSKTLSDPESSEAQSLKLSRSMLEGDQDSINEVEEKLSEQSDYDFLAAYSRGTALQAVGRFSEAVEAFEKSQKLNKLFRPSMSGIGENLLVLGRTDEAIAIFNDLEKLNTRSVDRKVNLASAYIEKGDLETAKKYLKEAHKLNPKHQRITEAKAQYFISQGKVAEAFKLMDQLSDVGPFFAAKLNEMGIKLSQQGKGKSALALYKKAHKIVRAELKYKISLNAALACYRMKDLNLAIKYLARCEKEYGKPLEKVQKIRGAIKKAQAKTKKAG